MESLLDTLHAKQSIFHGEGTQKYLDWSQEFMLGPLHRKKILYLVENLPEGEIDARYVHDWRGLEEAIGEERLNEDNKELFIELFHATGGEAQQIVRAYFTSMDGVAAWINLRRLYQPRRGVARINVIGKIMKKRINSERDILTTMTKMSQLIAQSGTYGATDRREEVKIIEDGKEKISKTLVELSNVPETSEGVTTRGESNDELRRQNEELRGQAKAALQMARRILEKTQASMIKRDSDFVKDVAKYALLDELSKQGEKWYMRVDELARGNSKYEDVIEMVTLNCNAQRLKQESNSVRPAPRPARQGNPKPGPRSGCFECGGPHLRAQCRYSGRPDVKPRGSQAYQRSDGPQHQRPDGRQTQNWRPPQQGPGGPARGCAYPAPQDVCEEVQVDRNVGAPEQGHVNHTLCAQNSSGVPWEQDRLLLDSGAADHVIHDNRLFTDHSFVKYSKDEAAHRAIKGISNYTQAPLGYGFVPIRRVLSDGRLMELYVKADYFPDLSVNLLSVNKLWEDFRIRPQWSNQGNVYLIDDEGGQVQLQCYQGLHYIHIRDDVDEGTIPGEAMKKGTNAVVRDGKVSKELQLWHERFNHANYRAVVEEMKKLGVQLKLKEGSSCQVCILSKARKANVPPRRETKDSDLKPGEVLNCDFIGPLPVLSVRGYTNAILFLDSATGYCEVYLLTTKAQAPQALEKFMLKLRTYGVDTKSRIRCDHDTVFTGQEWLKVCAEFSVLPDPTAPKCQYSNGRAESLVQHIVDTATSMLEQARLPSDWWGFAIKHAVSVFNMTSLYREVAPILNISGGRIKPNPLRLRKFGCTAYAHIDKGQRQKFDCKARRGCLVGYDPQMDAYLVFFWKECRVVDCVHVRFQEDVHYTVNDTLRSDEHLSDDEGDVNGFQDDAHDDEGAMSGFSGETHPGSGGVVSRGRELEPTQGTPNEETPTAPMRRSTRQRNEIDYADLNDAGFTEGEPMLHVATSRKIGHEAVGGGTSIDNIFREDSGFTGDVRVLHIAMSLKEAPEDFPTTRIVASVKANQQEAIPEPRSIPTTYNQAIKRPEAEAKHWRRAIESELESLQNFNTWTRQRLTDLTPKQRSQVIGTRFVFDVKRDANGDVLRYKARFVARGFTQIKGVNYMDSSSPVPSLTTVRCALTMAAANGYDVRGLDVSTAYLHALIDLDDIYIKLPPSLAYDDQGNELVGLLNRSIYGLKQAGFLWHHHFRRFLEEIGFERTETDPCVFKRMVSGSPEWILTYVDDCLILSKSKSDADQIVAQLEAKFEIKDLGRPSIFLGMNLHFSEQGQIHLSLTRYITQLAKDFSVTECNPVKTPMVMGQNLSVKDKATTDEERRKVATYRKLVGSLNWAASTCRPDVAFAVSQLARFVSEPGVKHMKAARRVLMYLWTTRRHGLIFQQPDNGASQPLTNGMFVDAFSDADHANDVDTRKSVSGVLVRVNGTAVCWASKRQSLTALSTAEAELYAAMETTKWVLFIQNLFRDFQVNLPTTTLFTDSSVLIDMLANRNVTIRTRHLDTRRHRVLDHCESGDIRLQHLAGSENTADMLTKSLPRESFDIHTSGMGIRLVD